MAALVDCQLLDPSSFIAGLIDKYYIVEQIEKLSLLADDNRTHVSLGNRVKAILLYGLGHPQRTLYKTPNFFETVQVERLFGDDTLQAIDFDDNALGRGLGKIAESGASKMLSELAFNLLEREGLLNTFLHLDSTSLKLSGVYEEADDSYAIPDFGYSKDKRPDLKQVVLTIVTTGHKGCPLWFQLSSFNSWGNHNDKTGFHETIDRVTSSLSQT